MAENGRVGGIGTEAGTVVGTIPAGSIARDGLRGIVLPILLAAAVLVAWELWVRLAHIPAVILPAPSAILDIMVKQHEILLRHAIPTVLESAAGFGSAFADPGSTLAAGLSDDSFFFASSIAPII